MTRAPSAELRLLSHARQVKSESRPTLFKMIEAAGKGWRPFLILNDHYRMNEFFISSKNIKENLFNFIFCLTLNNSFIFQSCKIQNFFVECSLVFIRIKMNWRKQTKRPPTTYLQPTPVSVVVLCPTST